MSWNFPNTEDAYSTGGLATNLSCNSLDATDLTITFKNYGSAALTSVDIEVLKWATEDDDCIEINDGYYWDESRTDLFIDFLDPPRIEKTKQDRLMKANIKESIEQLKFMFVKINKQLDDKLQIEDIFIKVVDKKVPT